MDLTVAATGRCAVEQLPIEMVERKGIGHPDTICDNLAEELSRALSAFYLDKVGRILHHNVDKALLIGGRTEVGFGGGRILEPIQIILAGRATLEIVTDEGSITVPVQDIVAETARRWLAQNVPDLPEDGYEIESRIRPGSSDLREIVERSRQEVPEANDTSLGVGHAPLSPAERAALAVEEAVRQVEPIGPDVKVMVLRRNSTLDITVAAAFVASRTPDADTYEQARQEIAERARAAAEQASGLSVAHVSVNHADRPERNSYYLTVTGTSAENGDDGQVGRGNRLCGLITPFRPMSLEAVAGKNPVSHIGKIYNRMAQLIAEQIVQHVPGAEVVCFMLSRIGSPITDPLAVHIDVAGVDPAAVEPVAKQAVDEVLSSWREIQDEFVQGARSIA